MGQHSIPLITHILEYQSLPVWEKEAETMTPGQRAFTALCGKKLGIGPRKDCREWMWGGKKDFKRSRLVVGSRSFRARPCPEGIWVLALNWWHLFSLSLCGRVAIIEQYLSGECMSTFLAVAFSEEEGGLCRRRMHVRDGYWSVFYKSWSYGQGFLLERCVYLAKRSLWRSDQSGRSVSRNPGRFLKVAPQVVPQ